MVWSGWSLIHQPAVLLSSGDKGVSGKVGDACAGWDFKARPRK